MFDREDADCYGNKGCVMKKAGLYYCSEINEIVDKEACRECNDDFDCGCCPDMLTDTPPFNCKECGKIKIEFEAGTYCFDKNKDPQKVAEMIKDIIENRGPYFSC